MRDYYGQDFSYIHVKFGDMRKMYFFTDEFVEKHPKFCEEYQKYWNRNERCRFKSALEIAQYVDMFDIPVKFYFNFTDTPVKDMAELYSYFIHEYAGIPNEEDGLFRKDYDKGLDGEVANDNEYKVMKIRRIHVA